MLAEHVLENKSICVWNNVRINNYKLTCSSLEFRSLFVFHGKCLLNASLRLDLILCAVL